MRRGTEATLPTPFGSGKFPEALGAPWEGPGDRGRREAGLMDPATCRGFPHPGLQVALDCLWQFWGGLCPRGGVGRYFPTQKSSNTCDLPRGLAPGYMELACFAGHPPAQELGLAPRHGWWWGERGDLLSPPSLPGCERAPPGCILRSWGEKPHRNPFDRIDLLRIWEDVSS